MDITFADVRISDLFKVIDVRKSILPDRENYSYSVPDKHGSYYGGYKYLPRPIEIDIMIQNDVMNKTRQLAWMLDLENPSELKFSNEPNRVYYAVVDGSTSLDEIASIGQGTITFMCFDPFAYSTTQKEFYIDNTQTMLINNEGTASTSPIFEIDIAEDTGYIALVSPDGVVQIGNPKEIDGITLAKSETLINDEMKVTTGWTVNTTGKVRTPSAVIQGTVKTVGNPAYGITANSYGTGTGWYGATIRKPIPASKDGSVVAQNFQVSYTFEFKADDGSSKTSDTKQTGRMEFNLMDESNNFLMGMTMRDSYTGYEFNIPEFYVGTKQVWTDFPKIPAPKQVKQYNKTKKKYETKSVAPTHVGKWNDFYGKIIMRRTGDEYYFELQKIDYPTGKIVQRVTKTFKDNEALHSTKKVKNINIWFGKYGNQTALGGMSANHITFRKDNVSNWHELPNLLTTGDKLVIDCEESTVYLNDALFMDRLDIGSTFFEVEEGQTEVRLVCSSFGEIASAKAIITEKYL